MLNPDRLEPQLSGFMSDSFLLAGFLALIFSETVSHRRGPLLSPDNAYDRAPNPVVEIVGGRVVSFYKKRAYR